MTFSEEQELGSPITEETYNELKRKIKEITEVKICHVLSRY